MADSAVTDTHALLMHVAGRPSLGPKASAHFRAAEAGGAVVYVPMVVLIETALLARMGRINLRRSPDTFFAELFLNPAYQPFDLSQEQVFAADALGFTHDPWDALMVAAATVLGLPLITRDTAIVASRAVKVIW